MYIIFLFLSTTLHVILYREEMDKADVHRSFSDFCHGVWHSILHQLHRYLLPCLQSHPIRHHGEFLICLIQCTVLHLHVRLILQLRSTANYGKTIIEYGILVHRIWL